MPALHWTLRRFHCRHTHHLLAVDALGLVQTPAGKRLASWLLRYHRDYLAGAIDPDVRICDFQNQIIHVEDGYWGGGPRVAQLWYHRLLQNLQRRDFRKAAQSAGILTHYFTDALQPLHTGETRRESLVHLPFERSVFHCYDAIRQHWIDDPLRGVFRLTDHPEWLRHAMLHGAQLGHQKFSLLVNSYRFDDGVADPTAGLNNVSRSAMAEVIGLTLTGLARIVERAAQDAEGLLLAPLPCAGHTAPLIVASIRCPQQAWAKWREANRSKRQAMAIAKEYRKRGFLSKHLPHEVDIKQRVNQVRRDEKIYQAAMAERARAKLANQSDATRQDHPKVMTVPIQEHTVCPPEDHASAPAVKSVDRIDARLLLAAGYHTRAQLAAAETQQIHAELQRLALTKTGQRILRGQSPPSLEAVHEEIRRSSQGQVA
ncbi:DUF4332 domain-containing protein [Planctomycetes bacterium K23_9]|uniref:DUF4332 domain-containing protein n=1 Tax=Stieleria marina TaxID=1930275 RepID=A0A517NLX3_9BACT|nr:hypothetical protein K239x_00720 [Planctomycetes bacterium K23_9]